jgi:hypothetical protein
MGQFESSGYGWREQRRVCRFKKTRRHAGAVGAGMHREKFVEGRGRLGNLNYEIYSLAAGQENGSFNTVFRHDIPGSNGVYSTHPGYNLVLGNGTVIANHFVQGPSLPAAGVPQTPTNPKKGPAAAQDVRQPSS